MPGTDASPPDKRFRLKRIDDDPYVLLQNMAARLASISSADVSRSVFSEQAAAGLKRKAGGLLFHPKSAFQNMATPSAFACASRTASRSFESDSQRHGRLFQLDLTTQHRAHNSCFRLILRASL